MKRILIFLILCCSIADAQNPYRHVNNFNAGELSPLLSAREDLLKYQSGCAIMENMIPYPQGGVAKRPGTKYIAEVKTSSLATRILPFEFSTSQSYIIEAGNQYMRFYTGSARINGGMGTEDVSSIGNIVAHWLLNDNLATPAVLDDDGGTHDGVMAASVETSTVHKSGKVGSGSFDFDSQYAAEITDSSLFTFNDSSAEPFSIAAWVYVDATSTRQHILSKWDDATVREWSFYRSAAGLLTLHLYDETVNVDAERTSDDVLTGGWHFIVCTYDGLGAGTAANGITLYVDGSSVSSTPTTDGNYVRMRDTATKVVIGAWYASGSLAQYFKDKIDNVAIFSKELSSSEVTTLYNSTIYEIATPYLTADLFELKLEQSADILYITHPDYETGKLSRRANARWEFDVLGIGNGPFRSQNITETKTISASGTTGSITLTAVGHAPFLSGHLPSGVEDTDKSQTGALFKLVYPLTNLSYFESLGNNYTSDSTEGTSWLDCGILYKGATWDLTTIGTWTGTLNIQRNYTIGAAHDDSGWEDAMPPYISTDDRNAIISGTEAVGDASYRVILTASGDAAEPLVVYFSTDQTEHIGIVKITAVASSISATATVLTTLASTDATHKWSEGSWSNYRGWPRTVTFFEDRLIFGGNTAQPDTVWGSVTSDYENMKAGAEDDEAVIFTLSSRQVNVIEWIIGKDKILIGTSGAEWTISGGTDEPLTPSNALAKQHSTYGSANLQAGIANESILFFQRGAEKMRELAYNWELDTYVAPDMTILANTVTDSGIVDTAFQKTPDSILWCVRTDGELPVFAYERNENITAWSRMITQVNHSGTLTDSDFESVARISGNPEDEVWVIVKRTMTGVNSGNPVRYIEQFQPRDFGDAEDAFYVDSGVTYDDTPLSAMTGLDHLNGQTVYVLADGVVFDTEVVSSGAITLSLDDTTTTASTVQMGLVYEVNLQTMPLSWVGGQTIQGRIKRISEVVVRWFESGDFSIGKSATKTQTYSISGQTTDIDRKTFPPGFDREGQVFIYQKSPEPLTVLSVMLEFSVE